MKLTLTVLTVLLLAPLAVFAQEKPAATVPSPLEEIFPVKVKYPGEPLTALKASGTWTESNQARARALNPSARQIFRR
jgi:hypothetical protein